MRFFTFGGASSHDIDAGILEPSDPDFVAKRKKLDRERALYRVNRVSWWAEEEQEEGLRNLEKYQYQVDCILELCDFKICLFGHYHANERIGGKFVLLDDEVFILKLGSVFKSEKAIEKIAPIYCMSRPPLCRGIWIKNGRNFQNKTQCGNPSLDEKR